MKAEIRLRPLTEEDLALLHRLFSDPAATGEHEGHGGQHSPWLRRQWDETRMLSEDSGMLMVASACTRLITGTPAKAGRYAFTVKITPQPTSFGQPGGPSGTQKLTITVGTGHSDRIVLSSATWRPKLYPDPAGLGV